MKAKSKSILVLFCLRPILAHERDDEHGDKGDALQPSREVEVVVERLARKAWRERANRGYSTVCLGKTKLYDPVVISKH